MLLKNPTENEVKITIAGVTKSIPANGSIQVEDEFGNKWKATHEFLQVGEYVVETVTASTKEETEESVAEVVVSETVIKPKKAKK